MTNSLPAFAPQPWASARGRRPARVRIVADSATDILPTHAAALGIYVVPNRVILDGAILRDGIDISPSQFFARLPVAKSVSSEPASAQDFYTAYQTAFARGATEVLSIHISSRLSKVVANALAAKRYLESPGSVHVIDSQQAGIGMWPAVIGAAKLANFGASIDEVRAATLATLARTRVYFLVESLEYLRRSGRIGRARELIGTLINAHPILTIEDGEVTPFETVRPRSRALYRVRELALSNSLESLLICGSSIESISELERVLSEGYTGVIQKTWLGPTLAANTGPVLALALVSR